VLEPHEITDRLDDWVADVLKDERLGLPPDAKLQVRPSSSMGSLFGYVVESKSEPTTGIRSRGFNLAFKFRDDEDPELVDEVPDRLREAIESDPTLGGRFSSGDVDYRDCRRRTVQDGDDAPDLTVRVVVRQLET
jgi:hypothetical protein